MASDFKSLKTISQTQKDLVFGYFREYQLILSKSNNNNPYYNIPDLLIFLTLSFYAIKEYFQIIPSNKPIALSNSNQTITKISPETWDNACIASQIIDTSQGECRYKWLIKIENMNDVRGLQNAEIGFVCDTSDTSRTLSNTKYPNFAFDCRLGCIIHNGNYRHSGSNFSRSEIKTGDVMEVEFFHDKHGDGYIKYSKVGTDKELLFNLDATDSDGVQYRLAVSLRDASDCLSIIDFECDQI